MDIIGEYDKAIEKQYKYCLEGVHFIDVELPLLDDYTEDEDEYMLKKLEDEKAYLYKLIDGSIKAWEMLYKVAGFSKPEYNIDEAALTPKRELKLSISTPCIQ